MKNAENKMICHLSLQLYSQVKFKISKHPLFEYNSLSLTKRCESPYLLQYFSDARSHLLKGLRGELIFAEVLQDLGV